MLIGTTVNSIAVIAGALAGMLLEKATGKIAYSNQTLVDYLDVILKSTIPQALIVADEKRRASERTEQ